jgi:cobalt-zinc-cadmium efflux system membrane fusion protein
MSADASSSLPASVARAAATSASPLRRIASALAAQAPNVAVIGFLAAIFYLGHRFEWKMPSMATLRGEAAAPAEDWCLEHLVPESVCIECQPDLLPRPPEFGFCKEHGVAECVLCHPEELAQTSGRPQLPRYEAAPALKLIERPQNNSRSALARARVQFASSAAADRAGIDIDIVQERPMADVIVANGEILFDPNRVAHLSSRVAGTVAFVYKGLGDDVEPGEILTLVEGADVGKAKAELLHAVVQARLRQSNLERLRENEGAIARRALVEAEAAVEEAEINSISARQSLVNLGFDVPDQFASTEAEAVANQLRFLGIPERIVASLPAGTKTANLIPIRATYEGTIVAADIVAGEVVDAASLLFTIANPSHVWLVLNVRQENARHLRIGLPVDFQSDDGAQRASGRVTWISPAIDERTRTLQTRVVLDVPREENPEAPRQPLRDKTYGMGRIVLREEEHAVVVPKSAVQATADGAFVFVRDRNYLKPDSPKAYHARQVRLGAADDEFVELLAGVLPGEVVAAKGAQTLLAQLLRGNLGAGCGCHEQ